MTIFGRRPDCPRCGKAVYMAEEVLGPEGSWHRSCFKCRNCNKSLSSTNMTEHDKEIYCRACYKKLFSLKGSRALLDPIKVKHDPHYDSNDQYKAYPALPTPPSLSSMPSSMSAASPESNRASPTPTFSDHAESSPSPKPTQKFPAANTPPRYFSPSAVFATNPRQLNIPTPKDRCPRCDKVIYAVEKVVGPGGPWHRSCLSCINCKKSLNSGQVVDHEGEAYCTYCHKRMWKEMPKPRSQFQGGSESNPDFSPKSQYSPQATVRERSYSVNLDSGTIRAQQGYRDAEPSSSPTSVRTRSRLNTLMSESYMPSRAPTPSISMLSNLNSNGGSTVRGLIPSTTFSTSYVPKRLNFNIPADTCPRCNERIYAAELMIGGGRKYHRRCFRCQGCSRTMDSQNMNDRDGNIYCNKCYKTNFGPKLTA